MPDWRRHVTVAVTARCRRLAVGRFVGLDGTAEQALHERDEGAAEHRVTSVRL